MLESLQHPLLDCVFRDQVNYGDGARLMFAPGPGDPLFQPGRIPWEVTIDHHARILQIQPGTPRIGAQEDPAVRIALEQLDFGPAASLWHGSGVQGIADPHLSAQVLHQFQHPCPF